MKIREVVKTKKGYVLVDTCRLTSELGIAIDLAGFGNPDAVGKEFETMVFACNKKGDVEVWMDLDRKNYNTEKSAKSGHERMVKKWELKDK